MMSTDNPFGLRPDELASAIISGNIGQVNVPTVKDMQTSISHYNKTSSVAYTADEAGLFNRMAEALNKNVVQPTAQAAAGVTSQVLQNPFQPVSLPIVDLQQMPQTSKIQSQSSGILAGIDNSKIESYIVLGVLFMILSSILGLFRR